MTDHEHTAEAVQIGALAKATGVTVRTLRHYDAIGLLVPDERSHSGRRRYSEQSVQRLYRIVALRQLGFSLDQVASVLDESPDLSEAVRRHLSRVEDNLALQRRLRRTLTRMLELLERQREPTIDQFIQAIEEITMSDKYYTPEQQEQLSQRAWELGENGIRQAERDWAELIITVKAERAAGTDPTDPRVLDLARQWQALIEQFTGGDERIRESLGRMYREEGSENASHGMVDPELVQYIGQALATLKRSD